MTIKNDPRILKYGNFLRKTKINELPQLINILLGDMSFIGPRPLTLDVFNKYPLEIRKKYQKLNQVCQVLVQFILEMKKIF